jgi:O-antigen/teichoic acid export membrane protein
VLLLFPGVVMVAVSRHDLVVLLYSHRYDAAASSLAVLVVGYGALALFSLFGFVLNGAGRTRLAPICAGAGVLTSVIVCSVLIPDHGLVGAAIGSAAGSGVAMLSAGVSVGRLLRLRLPVASTLRAAVGAAVTGLVIAALHPRPLLLPAVYIVALVAYLAILVLTREPGLRQLAGAVREHGGRRRMRRRTGGGT